MTFVYIVRCNFSAPDKEQAWNDWYSGPKIAQMLRKPHFLSCQRFRRAAGTGRDYLALWTLETPDAFRTEQYTTDWGFFEWERHVADWSRDLFDGGAASPGDFAVARDGSLEVMSFDGMGAGDTRAANAAIVQSGPDMMWLPVAGLDRHTPLIGLRRLPVPSAASLTGDAGKVQHASYRPLCDFQNGARQAPA
jgi:hypothetical protein